MKNYVLDKILASCWYASCPFHLGTYSSLPAKKKKDNILETKFHGYDGNIFKKLVHTKYSISSSNFMSSEVVCSEFGWETMFSRYLH